MVTQNTHTHSNFTLKYNRKKIANKRIEGFSAHEQDSKAATIAFKRIARTTNFFKKIKRKKERNERSLMVLCWKKFL